jgi:tetratricopeptide (TPR) repeat protein
MWSIEAAMSQSYPTAHLPLPDSYEGLLLQARNLQETGQTPDAIALYQRLIDKLGRLSVTILDRRPELRDLRKQAIVEAIDLLRWEQRFGEAVELQKQLLDGDPERAVVWRRRLASLRIQKGDVETGLADLRVLVEEAPDDPWNWLVLGHEALLAGRFAESQAALDRAVSTASKEDKKETLAAAYYERFRLFKEMSRWDDAVQAWEQALAAEPGGMQDTIPEVHKMLTDAGLYGMARTYAERDQNPLTAGLRRGLLDYLTGKPADAVQEWRGVAALDPAAFDNGQEAWMEAVLRLCDPAPVLEQLEGLLLKYESARILFLSGMAWAMHSQAGPARALLEQAIHLSRRERPPKQKLDGIDWRLLNSLVPDAQLKTTLKPYFAVIETTWEQPLG